MTTTDATREVRWFLADMEKLLDGLDGSLQELAEKVGSLSDAIEALEEKVDNQFTAFEEQLDSLKTEVVEAVESHSTEEGQDDGEGEETSENAGGPAS